MHTFIAPAREHTCALNHTSTLSYSTCACVCVQLYISHHIFMLHPVHAAEEKKNVMCWGITGYWIFLLTDTNVTVHVQPFFCVSVCVPVHVPQKVSHLHGPNIILHLTLSRLTFNPYFIAAISQYHIKKKIQTHLRHIATSINKYGSSSFNDDATTNASL